MKIGEQIYGQSQNSSGEIRPETVYNVVKQNVPSVAYGGGGEMGDLARLGRQLKPTIPDSGTMTQAVGMGALTGAGALAYLDPTIALGALGTVGTARGINKAMGSNYLQNGMRPSIQNATKALDKSGAINSLLRVNKSEDDFSKMDAVLQGDQTEDFSDMDAILQQDTQPQTQAPQDDFSDMDAILQQSQGSFQTQTPEQAVTGQMAVQPSFLDRVAMAESSGNPNARATTSSASGLYQFTDPTWRGMVKNYGAQTGITEADKNNPDKQKIMADLLTKENTQAYNNAGIQPDETDLYLAHFLGGPSAVKARKNLDAVGADLLPQAAQANKNIFYKNGQPRTVGEIRSLLGSKIGA
jgi:hypothetical protein